MPSSCPKHKHSLCILHSWSKFFYPLHPQEDCYEFTSVLLHDVCNFCDGGVCHVHINFKARNVTTNSEELFFAELALINNVFDQYSGYTTTACCIIDGNCLGMLLSYIYLYTQTHVFLFFHDWLSRNHKRRIVSFTSFPCACICEKVNLCLHIFYCWFRQIMMVPYSLSTWWSYTLQWNV